MLVQKKDSKNYFAMKILRKDFIEKKNQKIHTKTERTILEKLNCKFIVNLHYAFQTDEKLYLVMDFLRGGHLYKLILKDNIF